LVLEFDAVARRSDPKGLLVRFDAGSDQPITRVILDLEGDGEPPIEVGFTVGRGFDGRYVRALAFKPTVNGTWPLVVTAFDAAGRSGSSRCTPGVTVTF
jgi:hypothetical protein